jgi:hypothetical protein
VPSYLVGTVPGMTPSAARIAVARLTLPSTAGRFGRRYGLRGLPAPTDVLRLLPATIYADLTDAARAGLGAKLAEAFGA